MMWTDIAMIVFAVTSANHMGLIDAMERVAGCSFPIVNCCKCGSFWLTLAYGLSCHADAGCIAVIAMSFLAAISSVWLELLMGFIDIIYNKFYDKLYDKAAVTETDGNENGAETESPGSAEDEMPTVQLT